MEVYLVRGTNHLGHRIRILSQAIRQEIDRKLTDLELTGQQSFILRFLSERQGQIVYPKDIERRFNLTHPTVSGLLQRLEAKGFLTCTPDPDDRRYKRVALTQRGLECQVEIYRHILSLEQTMTAGMSADDVDTLIRLLDRAAENLNVSVNYTPCKEDCKP